MDAEKKARLIASLNAYRNACRPEDIAMFGENYWKERVLRKMGSLESAGADWIDYYSEEIADGLDNNVTILEVATVLINEFK